MYRDFMGGVYQIALHLFYCVINRKSELYLIFKINKYKYWSQLSENN